MKTNNPIWAVLFAAMFLLVLVGTSIPHMEEVIVGVILAGLIVLDLRRTFAKKE